MIKHYSRDHIFWGQNKAKLTPEFVLEDVKAKNKSDKKCQILVGIKVAVS